MSRAREAEVAQHAELAPPRPGERGEAAGHAGERDHDRDRLERVGDGEACGRRPRASAGGCSAASSSDEARHVGQRGADRRPDDAQRRRRGPRGARARSLARASPRGRAIVLEVHQHRAPGARVVAEHAGDDDGHGPARDRQRDRARLSRQPCRSTAASLDPDRHSARRRAGASRGRAWKPREHAIVQRPRDERHGRGAVADHEAVVAQRIDARDAAATRAMRRCCSGVKERDVARRRGRARRGPRRPRPRASRSSETRNE